MKIITFNLGETIFSVKMDMIKEIMPYPTRIARLPNQSEFIIGVTNVRGHVTSILDINKLLNTQSQSDPKFLIVIENGDKLISFSTDNMPVTQDITGLTIDKEFAFKSDFIFGIVDTKRGLTVIIETIKLFNLY